MYAFRTSSYGRRRLSVGQSVFYSDRRLEAQQTRGAYLWAHRNTVADSGRRPSLQ